MWARRVTEYTVFRQGGYNCRGDDIRTLYAHSGQPSDGWGRGYTNVRKRNETVGMRSKSLELTQNVGDKTRTWPE